MSQGPDSDVAVSTRPMHVYCQRIVRVDTDRVAHWCSRKAVGSDPNNPLMSLCQQHLDELDKETP